MNAIQEDKLGMFIKCKLYLQNNAATLAINPAIAVLATSLDTTINAIVDADSTATRDLTGYTQNKAEVRTQLETAILTVAAACRGYYTTNANTAKKQLVSLVKTDLYNSRDADVLVISDRILDVATPLSAQLAPWGVNAATITSLNSLTNSFKDWVQKPRTEQINSQVAGEQVGTLFGNADVVLGNADDQMAIYQYTNEPLYSGWVLSRAIDNSGGGSDSAGFDVSNYTVPANGLINFVSGSLTSGKQLYLRVIGGNGIIVCSTDDASIACNSGNGFTAQPQITYKKTLTEMGLDTTKTNLQFTNTGTVDVVVRAGFAI